jgi:hypothetical protein
MWYIAGSSTCSTKELSIHLTRILSAVKEGQQKYCETVYSRSGINHMWILKNSKDLLDNLKSRYFSYRWGTPAYWSLVPRSSMFYLFEFCLNNMWNCSLTQQILSHSFYDYRYIDDVLSINNSRFAEFLPLIYPPELEVKETTGTASSTSFLDFYLKFDDSGQLSTKIYFHYMKMHRL